MDCCDNENIACKNYEDVCLSCGTIHNYQYVNMLMKYLLKIKI